MNILITDSEYNKVFNYVEEHYRHLAKLSSLNLKYPNINLFEDFSKLVTLNFSWVESQTTNPELGNFTPVYLFKDSWAKLSPLPADHFTSLSLKETLQMELSMCASILGKEPRNLSWACVNYLYALNDGLTGQSAIPCYLSTFPTKVKVSLAEEEMEALPHG